jgi:hypothetical protein
MRPDLLGYFGWFGLGAEVYGRYLQRPPGLATRKGLQEGRVSEGAKRVSFNSLFGSQMDALYDGVPSARILYLLSYRQTPPINTTTASGSSETYSLGCIVDLRCSSSAIDSWLQL